MNAAEMAIILSVFFLIGIMVGIIAVIAISAVGRNDASPPAPSKITTSPPGRSAS